MTDTVTRIIAFESGELDFKGTLHLFADLIKSGQAWTLPGSYGRNARALIDQGYISEDGEVLKEE